MSIAEKTVNILERYETTITRYVCVVCGKATAGRKEKGGYYPRRHNIPGTQCRCDGSEDLAETTKTQGYKITLQQAHLLATIEQLIEYQRPRSGVIRLQSKQFKNYQAIMRKVDYHHTKAVLIQER